MDDMDRPAGVDAVGLIARQIAGISAWAAQAGRERAVDVQARTREMRLDSRHRIDARRREQQAVLARADQHLAASVDVLHVTAPLRAVVAHRNPWLCRTLVTALGRSGVQVVAVVADGADAVGTVVVEQPDVVLVEDRLPTLTGLEVVRKVHRFASQTVIGTQVSDQQQQRLARACGAHAVFSRTTAPHEMVAEFLRLLDRRPGRHLAAVPG